MKTGTRTRALLSGWALAMTAGAAFAAPVDSGPINIEVPNNIDGIYLNIVTGATGSSAGATPGWDINLFNGGNGFALAGSVNPTGQGVAGIAGAASVLVPGAVIDATREYLRGVVSATGFHGNGERYFGLRFINEFTGVANFGFVLMRNGGGQGADSGFPATIIRISYCNAGEVAFIPAVPGLFFCVGSGQRAADLALFISNNAGYAVANGAAKTGGAMANVGDRYSFFARVLNLESRGLPMSGGQMTLSAPATSRLDSVTCSGGVQPNVFIGPGVALLTGINFNGVTNPPRPGGLPPLTCRFDFTAIAPGSGVHVGRVSQDSPGNVTSNDVDTFDITVIGPPPLPINALNAWAMAVMVFLLGWIGIRTMRRG